MKTLRSFSFIVPLAVATFALVGCSDFDNGYTEKEMKFNADFNHEFGSFDETQDWNLAERARVTVTTSELKDINVYTEKDGIYVQVGTFKNVMGTKKLEFDVIEDVQNLVVSDGDVALRAVVGGTVNFDDMTSAEGEVMETRGGEEQRRNMWKELGYRIPANITEAERRAVVEEFSYPHYQAYNEVLVPWNDYFIQQVYKGEASYVDAFNQNTGTASDEMDRLMVWDNSAPEWSKQYDNSYLHVNDFNSGNQEVTVYSDDDINHESPIIGITLMCDLDPNNCPTEEVTLKDAQGNEVKKNWVKQFMYHNSQSSEYKATYILKNVSWEEPDGTKKSGTYLGFDFMADKPAGQPANLNMDVTRDWVFNDWIIKLSEGLDVTVPVSELQNAQPQAWILAAEDLGGGFDIDYNDVVVAVERDGNSLKVTPLAAGGTLASYLFFEIGKDNYKCVGEIHQLFGEAPVNSGSYHPVNLGEDIKSAATVTIPNVPETWSLSSAINEENNMGGFTIRVLPAGAPALGYTPKYDDSAFDKATDVKAPVRGQSPYILCVPFAYTLINYPETGKKTASIWEWPTEQTYICDAYPEFAEWVKDKKISKDWYSKPAKKGFVSTKEFTRRKFGEQPATMTDNEIEKCSSATVTAAFKEKITPSGYTSVEPPVATLELKEGVTEVSMTVGQTIDLLDYVTTNYPKCVYLSSDDYSAFTPVEAHKITCGISGHASTIHIKIATPTGVLERTLKVNSNGNNSDNQQQDQQDNQGEQGGQENGDDSTDYGTRLGTSTIESYERNNPRNFENTINVADLPTSGSVTLTFVIDWPYSLGYCSIKAFRWDNSNVWDPHWVDKDLGANIEKKGDTYYIVSTTVDASTYQGCPFIQFIFYNGTLKGAYYKQN